MDVHVTASGTAKPVRRQHDRFIFISVRTRMQTVPLVLNFRVASSHLRLYSTLTSHANSNSGRLILDKHDVLEEQKERDALLRKRKTEWKRRQGVRRNLTSTNSLFTPDSQGETFLDHLIVHARAGM